MHSGTDAYSILKSTNHFSHFSSLPPTLGKITLKAYNIIYVQYFHGDIDTAIMNILLSNDFMTDYTDLPQDFDYEDYILPLTSYHQYADAKNMFKVSRIFHWYFKTSSPLKV